MVAANLGSQPILFMGPTATVVRAYVDGFNLYHAIDNHVRIFPQNSDFKWLNLRTLCEAYALPPKYDLDRVFYFSAFATWLPGPYRRHQCYVSALRAVGVEIVMGRFKEKDRRCKKCGARWKGHEEKESDMALGVQLVEDAIHNRFERAYVVTADSDIVPALRAVARLEPPKDVRILFPPGLPKTYDLVKAVRGRGKCTHISWGKVKYARLPREVYKDGDLWATRPHEYDPPGNGPR